MAEVRLPTVMDLRALSLRAKVAYAARCAERVRPSWRWDDYRHVAAVAEAVAIAWRYAEGKHVRSGDAAMAAIAAGRAVIAAITAEAANYGAKAARVADATRAAARAAEAAAKAAAAGDEVTTDAEAARFARAARVARVTRAAETAGRAAAEAAEAAAYGATVLAAAARADCDRLRAISGEQCSELGDPIDLSENGPLGPLWPEGPPPGWPEQKGEHSALPAVQPDSIAQSFSVYLDPGDAPTELLTDFFVALASVYRSMGGSGLKIVKDDRRLFVVEGVES